MVILQKSTESADQCIWDVVDYVCEDLLILGIPENFIVKKRFE